MYDSSFLDIPWLLLLFYVALNKMANTDWF